MRVAYDHRIFSLQPYGGISRYFFELASRIAEFEGCEVSLLALAHINGYLREARSAITRGVYLPHVPKTGWIRRFFNDAATSVWLRRSMPDILHESYYSAKALGPKGARIVLTVYDMIHEKLPHYFPPGDQTARRKAEAIRRADHIICISEATRRDLLQLHVVELARTSVVHLGCGLRGDPVAASLPLFTPYLLYVGDRRGYKNFRRLLVAVAGSPRLQSTLRLVCFGGGRLTRPERSEIARLGLKEGSVVHVRGEDTLLASLYTHAVALVYPSLYEGFGMPTLEAMALGCPVICSAAGALPEIVGEAGTFFDPMDEESIARAIEAVVFSEEERTRLCDLGVQRVKQFTWDRCAVRTHEVYQSLL